MSQAQEINMFSFLDLSNIHLVDKKYWDRLNNVKDRRHVMKYETGNCIEYLEEFLNIFLDKNYIKIKDLKDILWYFHEDEYDIYEKLSEKGKNTVINLDLYIWDYIKGNEYQTNIPIFHILNNDYRLKHWDTFNQYVKEYIIQCFYYSYEHENFNDDINKQSPYYIFIKKLYLSGYIDYLLDRSNDYEICVFLEYIAHYINQADITQKDKIELSTKILDISWKPYYFVKQYKNEQHISKKNNKFDNIMNLILNMLPCLEKQYITKYCDFLFRMFDEKKQYTKDYINNFLKYYSFEEEYIKNILNFKNKETLYMIEKTYHFIMLYKKEEINNFYDYFLKPFFNTSYRDKKLNGYSKTKYDYLIKNLVKYHNTHNTLYEYCMNCKCIYYLDFENLTIHKEAKFNYGSIYADLIDDTLDNISQIIYTYDKNLLTKKSIVYFVDNASFLTLRFFNDLMNNVDLFQIIENGNHKGKTLYEFLIYKIKKVIKNKDPVIDLDVPSVYYNSRWDLYFDIIFDHKKYHHLLTYQDYLYFGYELQETYPVDVRIENYELFFNTAIQHLKPLDNEKVNELLCIIDEEKVKLKAINKLIEIGWFNNPNHKINWNAICNYFRPCLFVIKELLHTLDDHALNNVIKKLIKKVYLTTGVIKNEFNTALLKKLFQNNNIKTLLDRYLYENFEVLYDFYEPSWYVCDYYIFQIVYCMNLLGPEHLSEKNKYGCLKYLITWNQSLQLLDIIKEYNIFNNQNEKDKEMLEYIEDKKYEIKKRNYIQENIYETKKILDEINIDVIYSYIKY